MTSDLADKEREFLAYLKADTGRDLEEWMQAIRAQSLPDRNAIIDWLRLQGFIFARASWLERIHNNGGRPIYLAEPPPSRPAHGAPRLQPLEPPPTAVQPPPKPQADLRVVPSGPRQAPHVEPAPLPQQRPPRPSAPLPPPVNLAPAPPLPPDIAATIAKAKAYAPLAGFLLRFALERLPGTVLTRHGDAIVLSRPAPFALLAIGSRELRLALALGETPPVAPFQTARPGQVQPLPQPGAPLTHVAVLTDARQIDADLAASLLRAAARANPPA